MRNIYFFIATGLLSVLPLLLPAQNPATGCRDVIRLKDGSTLRGQIQEIKHDGNTLSFRTWNGVVIDLPRSQVRRIVQRCDNGRAVAQTARAYDFTERGWYHHTRAGALIGQAYTGNNVSGYQLQHSSGWKLTRMFGAGIGAGLEYFDPSGFDSATYPIFTEIRGFLFPKRITPYYTLAGGWAFTGQLGEDRWGLIDTWKGGWLLQADIGYRIGNHFTVHCGLRLQQKTREWTSDWGPESGNGADHILYKRFVAGIGLLL
ncbi:MAG: hypothetical protein IPH12_11265 [Saprospirales bacterium]|jgi:hypothetical protein|nr:hypothetical protein [Saprospirales bacterium]MBK8919909.1 hypothetical protein [Saprospirales bacterium]